MRGKLYKAAEILGVERITPADAGENAAIISLRFSRIGSPPRMRGKRLRIAVRILGCRITPADAGKTQTKKHFTLSTTDHPRGCGENSHRQQFFLFSLGSPPRMRGKLFCHSLISSAYRITPADAGKTAFGCIPQAAARDHPRGCGENHGT